MLPAAATERLVAWQARELRGRVVPPDNLHVTLAFLGARPAVERGAIAAELRAAAARATRPLLRVGRYREARSAGMLTLDDEADRAGALAADVGERLERLGVYRREGRPWLPHVTVVRYRTKPRFRPEPPELEFSPSDAAVYLSRLRPSGAQYVVLDRFALGG